MASGKKREKKEASDGKKGWRWDRRGFRNGVESASVITIAAPLLISWQIRRG